MEEELISRELLEHHVLSDGEGAAIFLFNPAEALTEMEGGYVLTTEKQVLDFNAMLDVLSLPHDEDAALALATVLLEKREAGELTEYA